MEKIPINSVKLSDPLVLMRVRPRQGASDVMPALCRMLADLAVNIAFMTFTGLNDPHSAIYCIDPSDQPGVVAGLARDAVLNASVTMAPDPVGLLSIYPHRASMAVLGAALQALSENRIDVHALASSISALTFAIDFVHLDGAAAILKDAMNLPPGKTPLQAEFKVQQVRPAL